MQCNAIWRGGNEQEAYIELENMIPTYWVGGQGSKCPIKGLHDQPDSVHSASFKATRHFSR